MKRTSTLIMILILTVGYCLGQEGDLMDDMPVVEEPENSDLETGVFHRKLNLNAKFWTRSDARSVFTEGEIEMIRDHISRYGKFLHEHELQLVIGDLTRIREILPHIHVVDRTPGTDRKSRVDIQMRWSNGEFDQCGECRSSPVDLRVRSELKLRDDLYVGLVGESDRGEALARNGLMSLLDLQKAYLFWTREDVQVVLGHHHLRYGEGLFSNSFYLNKVSANAVGIKGGRTAILPSRSFNENPKRGIAALIHAGKTTVIGGVSSIGLDAAIDSASGSFWNWSESGYHRTPNEMERRKLLRNYEANLHAHRSFGPLSMGFSYRYERFSHPRGNPQRIDQFAELIGGTFHDLGFNYHYQGPNYFLFGELKSSNIHAPSFLTGLLMSLGEKFDLSLMFRNYRPDHTYWSSAAFGAQSSNKNELGIYTGISFLMGRHQKVDVVYDQYIQPWFSYAYKKGMGKGETCILTYNDRWDHWKIRIQYRYTKRIRNSLPNVLHRMRFISQKEVGNSFRVGVRLEYSRSEQVSSKLLAADLVYTLRKGRIFLRTYQSYGSDKLRFYFRESDLQNSFALTSFTGNVSRHYIMWEFKPIKGFKMRIKGWTMRRSVVEDSHSFGLNLQFLNRW